MFTDAGLYLIQTLFDFYIFVFILRFLLQTLHADYFNPLSQFALKLTQGVVRPFQKIIPDIKGIDLAVLLIIFLLEIIKLSIPLLVKLTAFPNVGGLLLLALVSMIKEFMVFYFYIILARVLMSWLAPTHHNPVQFALVQLTEPLLKPIRRIIPLIGGFDLAPLIAIIVLQVLQLLLIEPLLDFAIGLIL
ncbi:MAG: YggT family protein [Gammaproteobacteria bacterium]